MTIFSRVFIAVTKDQIDPKDQNIIEKGKKLTVENIELIYPSMKIVKSNFSTEQKLAYIKKRMRFLSDLKNIIKKYEHGKNVNEYNNKPFKDDLKKFQNEFKIETIIFFELLAEDFIFEYGNNYLLKEKESSKNFLVKIIECVQEKEIKEFRLLKDNNETYWRQIIISLGISNRTKNASEKT